MKKILMGFLLMFSMQSQLVAEVTEEYEETMDVMGPIDIPVPEKPAEEALEDAEMQENTDPAEARDAATEAMDEDNQEQALAVPENTEANKEGNLETASADDLEVQRAEEAELIEVGAGEEE